MATTQLNLKVVPTVPNLMVADFKTDDGDEMRAIVVDKNTIKIVSACGQGRQYAFETLRAAPHGMQMREDFEVWLFHQKQMHQLAMVGY